MSKQVTVNASSSNGPIQYRLEQGASGGTVIVDWQTDNVFHNVDPNDYLVKVKDTVDAQVQQAITVVDTEGPSISNTALSAIGVAEDSISVDFTKATDNATIQGNLIYHLYTSTSNNLDTAANAEANGTLQSSQTDVSSLAASGLSSETKYFFNVIVEDGDGNKSVYAQNSATTLDVTPPSLSDGTLSTSSVTENGFIVDYTAATDTGSATLIYTLYTSAADNLNSLPNAKTNGTVAASGTDVTSLGVSGYTAGDTVYFNIIVEDESGNETLYTETFQTTADLTIDSIDITDEP